MPEDTHVIQVLIVHEYPLMCNIIAKVIDGEADIQVNGFANSVDEALDFVMREWIDVVLISPRLPENGSIKLTKALMKKAPSVRILIIGISETREQVLQYIEAGASGYVIRESSVNDLLAVIRAAGAGKALVSPEIASALIQRVKSLTQLFVEDGKSLPDVTILTKREFQILQMVSQNFNNQEIADRLVISRGTVKNHIHNILEKLCVSSRTEAVNLFTSILNNSSDPDSGK